MIVSLPIVSVLNLEHCFHLSVNTSCLSEARSRHYTDPEVTFSLARWRGGEWRDCSLYMNQFLPQTFMIVICLPHINTSDKHQALYTILDIIVWYNCVLTVMGKCTFVYDICLHLKLH